MIEHLFSWCNRRISQTGRSDFDWINQLEATCTAYSKKLQEKASSVVSQYTELSVPYDINVLACRLHKERHELAIYYKHKVEQFLQVFSNHYVQDKRPKATLFQQLHSICRVWLFIIERTFIPLPPPTLHDLHRWHKIHTKNGLEPCMSREVDEAENLTLAFETTRQAIDAANIASGQLFKLLAELYTERKFSFPYKRLYEGCPDRRMTNLRKYEPVIDFTLRHPHNVHFFAKTYDGAQLLPLLFRGKSFSIIHGDADYERMDVIADFFQEEPRLRAYRKDKRVSPLEMWSRSDFVEEMLHKSLEKYGQISLFALREVIYEEKLECTQFKPSLAVTIMKQFHATRVLDFSAGWGDRLIGAIAANVSLYHAWDPNTALQVSK